MPFARSVAEDGLYLTFLVYLTEACIELDFSDKASALGQRLMPESGQMVLHSSAACHGPADLYLGMLATTLPLLRVSALNKQSTFD